MQRENLVRPTLEPLESRLAPAITFRFDYSLDSSRYFATNPAARAVLEQAGRILGNRLRDELGAISPGAGRTWTAYFSNPNNLKWTQRVNLNIPANTIHVFVGGARFSGDFIAHGSPGFGYGDSLSSADRPAWQSLVQSRGQGGNDFGPWGGSLSFNVASNWSFAGQGGMPASNQYDFLSTAVHELGHLLGIGTAPSWQANVRSSSRLFVGLHARATHGGSVPLASSLTHWAAGVRSAGQEPMMNEVLTAGTRKLPSPLDWAALADIGWKPYRGDATFAGGVLQVTGSAAADSIVIARVGSNANVIVNGVLLASVPVSSITQIHVATGDGPDAITIANLAKPITVEAGAGADRLIVNGSAGADTFRLNNSSLNAMGAVYSWLDLERLSINGLAGNDALIVLGVPPFAVGFNGGLGVDRLQGKDVANEWRIINATSGTLNDTLTIAAVESLIGGSAADKLIGPNLSNAWKITGNNSGSVGGFTFSAIENLLGGTLGDTFSLANGAAVSGHVDGGSGRNALSYSAFTTSVNVDLEAGMATNIAGGIANIADVFGGSAGDILKGNALDNLLSGNGGGDDLDGRGGDNILIGGAGIDILNGGNGRDILIGGSSGDTLTGGAGEDILISGPTTFETSRPALLALAAFWKRNDLAYDVRVAKLRAGVTGLPKLNGSTVLQDASIDTLAGGDDLDWYFAKVQEPSKDIIAELQSGEARN